MVCRYVVNVEMARVANKMMKWSNESLSELVVT